MTYRDDEITCRAPDCEEIAVSRGRCRRHYMAWYRRERAEKYRESQRRWRARVDYNAQRREANRRKGSLDGT